MAHSESGTAGTTNIPNFHITNHTQKLSKRRYEHKKYTSNTPADVTTPVPPHVPVLWGGIMSRTWRLVQNGSVLQHSTTPVVLFYLLNTKRRFLYSCKRKKCERHREEVHRVSFANKYSQLCLCPSGKWARDRTVSNNNRKLSSICPGPWGLHGNF